MARSDVFLLRNFLRLLIFDMFSTISFRFLIRFLSSIYLAEIVSVFMVDLLRVQEFKLLIDSFLFIISLQMSAEGNLRKSKRQPVPNPIYSQGINELKKESNIRHKKKTKNADDDFPSYSDEKNQYYDYGISLPPVQSKEPFLPCVMPRGNLINVQFVIQSKPKEEDRKKEVKTVQHIPPKPKKQAANLLSLFQKAIEDADIKEEASEEQNSMKQSINYQVPKAQFVQRPKRVRDNSNGCIQNVEVVNGQMEIKHSVLGDVSIPVEWQGVKGEEKEESEVVEMRKKLQDCKLIKNISILMA